MLVRTGLHLCVFMFDGWHGETQVSGYSVLCVECKKWYPWYRLLVCDGIGTLLIVVAHLFTVPHYFFHIFIMFCSALSIWHLFVLVLR